MQFELFVGADGLWYWRLKAANHQIVAIGGEGYYNRNDALNSLRLVKMSGSVGVLDLRINQWIEI